MRKTIIKDNIRLRLQDILGSELNDSDKFSIQSSMQENLTRACKAIVGDNVNGKVMAGMDITPSNGKVKAGYAITYSGKVIKFGHEIVGSGFTSSGGRINVYAIHTNVMMPGYSTETPNNTGYNVEVMRDANGADIIEDQAGSSSNPGEGDDVCLRYEVSNTVSTGPDEVFLGTIINNNRVVYSDPARNTDIDYISAPSATNFVMWTSDGTDTTMATSFTGSRVMIEPGHNYLRTMRLVLKNKTTSTIPREVEATDLKNYIINWALYQYDAAGNYISQLGNYEPLDDCASPRSFTLEVYSTLDPGCGYLGIHAKATTADFDTSTTAAYADVQYVIEKLK